MLVIAGLVVGGLLGALTARKRGGKAVDMAQYAAGYGIALGLAGVIVTIFIHRAMV